jgi:iron complex transport system ATP-binding protein
LSLVVSATVRRAGRVILDVRGLELAAGRFTALLGENGSGKSTLLYVAAGLLAPEEGSATIDGRDLAALPPEQRARALALLPALSGLPQAAFELRARDVVALGLSAVRSTPSGTTAPAVERAIGAALARADASHLAGARLDQLSSGERQRVEIARVVAQVCGDGAPRGRMALLDEPTSALDVRHRLLLVEEIRRLTAEGVGVVAALHDLDLALEHADDVVILRGGRVAHHGPPATVDPRAHLEGAFSVRFERRERLVAVRGGP